MPSSSGRATSAIETPVARAGKGRLRRGLVEARILDVAARTFAERGVAATNLEAIANELDLHRVSLYHYFESKEALVVRLLTDMLTSTESALREMRANPSASPPERLRSAVRSLLQPIVEAPHRFRLFLTSGIQLPPVLAQRQSAVRREVVADVTNIIRAGQTSGVFRAGDVEVTVFALVGMCNWVAWWPHALREGAPRLADQLADLAVAAVSVAAPASPREPSELIDSLRSDLERLSTMVEGRS